MLNILRPIGRLSGATGFVICLLAGLARLTGHHWVAGFETLTILQAGVAGMVFGCLCLLLFLTESTKHP